VRLRYPQFRCSAGGKSKRRDSDERAKPGYYPAYRVLWDRAARRLAGLLDPVRRSVREGVRERTGGCGTPSPGSQAYCGRLPGKDGARKSKYLKSSHVQLVERALSGTLGAIC